jgi:hypothetical protein
VGDCHYLYGNYMTVKRVSFLQDLLAFIGLEGRLHLAWISSAEAQRFVQVVTEFTEKIRGKGPSPLSRGTAPLIPASGTGRDLSSPPVLGEKVGVKGLRGVHTNAEPFRTDRLSVVPEPEGAKGGG